MYQPNRFFKNNHTYNIGTNKCTFYSLCLNLRLMIRYKISTSLLQTLYYHSSVESTPVSSFVYVDVNPFVKKARLLASKSRNRKCWFPRQDKVYW